MLSLYFRSTNATKKNLFTAPASAVIPMTMGTATTFASSSSNLGTFSGTGQIAYFPQNFPAQLHNIQQQQNQQQLYLHQSLTASDVVVKLSGVVALGGNDNSLQFVVPTSHQTLLVFLNALVYFTDAGCSDS